LFYHNVAVLFGIIIKDKAFSFFVCENSLFFLETANFLTLGQFIFE